MLFVGAIHQVDSPNYDGLMWFVREVLPLIEQELGWETRLTVAGYIGPEVSLEQLRQHPRITLRGTVSDLEALYNAGRIFVAPTRYAAGVPYKVHQAASCGIPVVATELLRRQLGWIGGRDLVAVDAGDPAAFAHAVCGCTGMPGCGRRCGTMPWSGFVRKTVGHCMRQGFDGRWGIERWG